MAGQAALTAGDSAMRPREGSLSKRVSVATPAPAVSVVPSGRVRARGETE